MKNIPHEMSLDMNKDDTIRYIIGKYRVRESKASKREELKQNNF